ncbi:MULTISPECIES: hotdog family protein [Streptomyces]|uniref:MaoC/PaaZ C-terminal domain-containing protein n=1 Tax=Streptomyces TaxID=1883 RepID=UPI00088EE7CE|nr:MaoC/PaaZ C-terminal domain-containing protein [Streptomyces sp. LaPpAH-199]MYW80941.1 acyl dehydratase [Streptomyces sp. SID8369]SDD02026.1 MaoC like domain-containing protein [Streptomyces sp. LaPpAH-199]
MTPPYRVGDELPPLEIPVTRTLIVAGAIASRDYQDVHHDAASAREKGSPDIFMNILTTNGLVGRYITDHFGPTAVLRKVAIRLGAPNYPGDVLRLTGRITELRTADASPGGASPGGASSADTSSADTSSDEVVDAVEAIEAVVQVTGGNGIGRHVTGTVAVTLPEPSAKRTGA